MDSKSYDKANSVQAVARACDIIDLLFSQAKPLTLTSISQQLNIPPVTTFRILNTLVDKKFIEKGSDDTYRLGLKFISLGDVVKSSASIYSIAQPKVARLRDYANESVNMAILMNGQILNIVHETGDSFLLMSALSPISPLHCSSIGNIFLADMDEETCKSFFQRPQRKYTKHTITSYQQFLSKKAIFEQEGLMYDNEEFEYGLSCIGAPIYDCNNELIAGVSVSGPTSRLKEKNLEKIKLRIKECAESITEDLKEARYNKSDLYKAYG